MFSQHTGRDLEGLRGAVSAHLRLALTKVREGGEIGFAETYVGWETRRGSKVSEPVDGRVPGLVGTMPERVSIAVTANSSGGFMARRSVLCVTGIAALGSIILACSADKTERTGDNTEQAFGVKPNGGAHMMPVRRSGPKVASAPAGASVCGHECLCFGLFNFTTRCFGTGRARHFCWPSPGEYDSRASFRSPARLRWAKNSPLLFHSDLKCHRVAGRDFPLYREKIPPI